MKKENKILILVFILSLISLVTFGYIYTLYTEESTTPCTSKLVFKPSNQVVVYYGESGNYINEPILYAIYILSLLGILFSLLLPVITSYYIIRKVIK